MPALPGFAELWILFVLVLEILIPLVLAILLIVWLTNKKRRDETMLESVAAMHQQLGSIRDRLKQLRQNR
jgi:hypothetical protein